jgi:hypothetical protein
MDPTGNPKALEAFNAQLRRNPPVSAALADYCATGLFLDYDPLDRLANSKHHWLYSVDRPTRILAK